MFGKKYKVTAKTKKELEKELKLLETKGRQDIASKLDFLRQQPVNEEDNPFSELLDDKNYLEKRISEIKEILHNSVVVDSKAKHKKVEVGSKVKVGFETFEDEYTIVSSIEADPLNKKISDESPVGKALLNARVGDSVDVKIGSVAKTYRILKIS